MRDQNDRAAIMRAAEARAQVFSLGLSLTFAVHAYARAWSESIAPTLPPDEAEKQRRHLRKLVRAVDRVTR